MECRIHIPQSLPINKSLTIFSVNSGYTLLYCLHVAYSRQGIRALHASTDTLAPCGCGQSEGRLAGCRPRHTGTGLPSVHLVPWALPPSEACTLQGPPKNLAPSDVSVGSSPSSSKAGGCWVWDWPEPVCALENRTAAAPAVPVCRERQHLRCATQHHPAATPGSTSSPLSPPSRSASCSPAMCRAAVCHQHSTTAERDPSTLSWAAGTLRSDCREERWQSPSARLGGYAFCKAPLSLAAQISIFMKK